eukprot:11178517-Lingulodinium_polyedra.AAC.1
MGPVLGVHRGETPFGLIPAQAKRRPHGRAEFGSRRCTALTHHVDADVGAEFRDGPRNDWDG